LKYSTIFCFVWFVYLAGALPKKLNLFLAAPHDVFAQNQAIDALYLPSREGVLGVMPGSFQYISGQLLCSCVAETYFLCFSFFCWFAAAGCEKTIAQLKPGVVAIHNGSAIQEFFVSGGFATIDGTNAHVTVGEAVPLDHLDSNAVTQCTLWVSFVSLFSQSFSP
jgi:F0F1-type ATP synthase epsilon subunit